MMSSKEELVAAFKSASSVGEMIETFKLIKESSYFHLSDLAYYCWLITDQLLQSPSNPQQVYSFCVTAMTVYARNIPCYTFPSNNYPINDANDINTITVTYNHGPTLFIAVVQYLWAASCFGLMRFDDSLRLLDWALDNLTQLDNDDKNRCPRNCVRSMLAATQQLLCKIKADRGKPDEAVVHAGNALKFRESVMQEGSIELGKAYVEAYGAYVAAKDAKEALPVCLKALEIYSNCQGVDPREVAMLRVELEILYRVVGDYENAAEQNQAWQNVLKNTDTTSDFLNAEIKVGNALIHFGKCDEAIQILRAVASRTDTGKRGGVTSFVNMARASCILEEFVHAKEHIRAAEIIIEQNDIGDPVFVGITSMNICEVYEMMDDLESAISLLKRVFENSENLQKNLAQGLEKFNHLKLLARSSTRLFSLISLAGKEKEEIPYMRDVVEKLEKCFGVGYIEVGYGCAKLGAAFFNSGQEDKAVKLIEVAKDIMDVTIGPRHLDSLKTRHTLSEIYAKLGRYNEAIEIEEMVIEGTNGLEQSEQQFIDKAVNLLNYLKERRKATERNEAKSQRIS